MQGARSGSAHPVRGDFKMAGNKGYGTKERAPLYLAIAAIFGPKAAVDAYIWVTGLAFFIWFLIMFCMD